MSVPYSDLLHAGRSANRFPDGEKFFRTSPDRPRGPHSLLYGRYRVRFVVGVKRPGLGVDHRPPPTTTTTHIVPRLKKEWKGESYFYLYTMEVSPNP